MPALAGAVGVDATPAVRAGVSARPIAAMADSVHLVAWTPDRLPARTAAVLGRMRGVDATTVLTGTQWLRFSRDRSGDVVDRPPAGYAIPLDVVYVHPHAYAPFVAARYRARIRSLGPRQALMSRGEWRLRRHAHLWLHTSEGTVHTLGRISNRAAEGYELLRVTPPPAGVGTLRAVLIAKRPWVERSRIWHRLVRVNGTGLHLTLASEHQTRFLRYANRVVPQYAIKRRFGEFAARRSGDRLELQPGWAERHIDTRRLPLLGTLTCNVRMFHPLREAMRELIRGGWGGSVHSQSGCYNPSLIAGTPGRVSRHAFGAAVDINAPENCYGCPPHQSRRLVRVMRRWGFGWGGTWALPDPMHFEWKHRPRAPGT